jgi:RIO kinase 1
LPRRNQLSTDASDMDSSWLDVDDAGDYFTPRARDRAQPRAGRRSGEPFFRDSVEKTEGPVAAAPAPSGEGSGGAVSMSYTPARYEEVWLGASLRSFFDQELIVDVLAQVKGGKEASVYRCRAHPRLGLEFLAAKVYRPRQFRNLRNDALYREGRPLLSAGGGAIPKRDRRAALAVQKKTEFGAKLLHTSWLMHEYKTLERLHLAGAAVPRPLAANENTILMTYYGDERRAAPTLNEVTLSANRAKPLFDEVLRNVRLMLEQGLVHGDLSAYNLLYWDGKIVLIDFPQGTSHRANQSAQFILARDVRRVCEYFARQGVPSDPSAIVAELEEQFP